MGLFDNFPYTNFHELNLMWILQALKNIEATMQQFVALNSLQYADPIQWDITRQYEKNTIVIDPLTGTAYISVQPVPLGVDITNTDYWTVVFDLESLVVNSAKNFTDKWERERTVTATFTSDIDDWIVWGDVLYRVIAPIGIGDQYLIGINIEHFTLESIVGHIEDLTTSDRTNIIAAINEVFNLIYPLSITTPEEFGAAGDGVTDDTTAVQQAISTGRLIKINNTYRVTDTLFIDGTKSIIGDGTIIFDIPYDAGTYQYGLICGSTALGVTGTTFTGTIQGVNFICQQGHFNYVLGLINAKNVEVHNCRFDLTSADCNCVNKVIFAGSDIALADTSTLDGTGYVITNNKIIFDDSPSDPRNLCESIGLLHRSNIIIDGNYIKYGKDDLGLHRCTDVIISNNNLIEVLTARIYVSNSKRFKILNNTMTVESTSHTQGIQVEWETTLVSAVETPEEFVIANNIIDYTNTNYSGSTYGIRISGAAHGIITNNKLLSNSDDYGIIVLENEPASGSLLTRLAVQDIEVSGNTARKIAHNIGSDSSTENIQPLFMHDNIATSLFRSSNIYNIVKGNVVTSDTGIVDIADNVNTAKHNAKFIFSGTGSGSWQDMLTDYETKEIVCTSRCLMSNRIALYNSSNMSLSGSDYFAFNVYVNGTLLRGINLQNEGPDTTNFHGTILNTGDKISVQFRYSGTVPGTQPDHVTLMLKLINFDDID